MRAHLEFSTIGTMSTEREYDQDTDGDFDDHPLPGSEGLDADTITTDGEDLTMDAPEEWKPVEEHDTLDEKLAAERPDTSARVGDSAGDDGEVRDAIDQRDPEVTTRVLGED